MAKQCDVCKQTYADELTYCPHCGAWQKGRAGTSSSVEFNLDPLGADASGLSDIVIGPGPSADDDVIEIDVTTEGSSASGTPVPRPASPVPPAKPVDQPKPPTEQAVPHAKPVSMPAKPADQPARGTPTQLAPGAAPVTQIAPPQGGEVVPPPRGRIEDSSSADFYLGEAPPVNAPAGSSSGDIDLGEAPPAVSPSGVPQDELIEILPDSSSGEIELGELPPITGPSGRALDDLVEIQMEGTSDVELGKEPPSDAGMAGPLSSDVRLAGPRQPPAAAGSEDVDIMHLLDEEGSAVDLGANMLIAGSSASPAPPARPPRGVAPGEATESVLPADAESMIRRGDDSSAVDLTAPSSGEMHASWISGLDAPAETAGALAQEWETGRAAGPVVAAPEDQERAMAVAQAPAKPPSKMVPWLGGGGVGVLVGVAACVSLWAAGLVPSRPTGNSATPSSTPVQPNPAVTAAPASQENPLTLLERGDFAKVLEGANETGGQPERLATRGEARWLAYVQKQPRNLKAEAPDVKEAITDLENAKTPEAKLWLGQIQESLGKFTEARTLYEEGRKEFPQQKALFDTALDRLEALTEEPDGAAKPGDKNSALPGRRPALGEANALVLLIALQAEQPAAAPADAEAGSYFWNAVKQAKKQNYAEALKALEEARKAHDQRRFQRLRKSQNPVSDPTEEIFLRACDELKGYWQLRAKLQAGGYPDVAKAKDLGQAVEVLLADLKKKPAGDSTLQAVVERLKKEKDVVSADPNLKEVAKDLDLVLESRKKQADHLAALQAALAGAKLPEEPADLRKGLEKLLRDQKEKMDALAVATKEVERLLADKKTAEDKLKTADEKLKSADEKLKTAAETQKADAQTLEDLAGKLAGAKVVAANARGAALVKGLEQVLADKKAVENKLKASGGEQALDALTLQKLAGKLTAAKVVAANAKGDTLVQGLDQVLADKKTAEEKLKTVTAQQQSEAQTLQDVAGKLAAAKVVAPNARGEALIKGLEQLIRDSLRPAAVVTQPSGVPVPERTPTLESLPTGDPLAAEQMYARGLANFWAGQYQAAEGDFAQAVRTAGSTGQDARYYYFLGLAQLGQGKRDDALSMFRQAARLERDNRPSSRVVSSALERIQGQLRRTVDTFRP
jgi:tetratricopeptide (TPR) repeat protein